MSRQHRQQKCLGVYARHIRMPISKALPQWHDIWQLPLRYSHGSCYVFSNNDVMALTFYACDLTFIHQVVACINDCTPITCKRIDTVEIKDGCDFYINGECSFCVRGWGHLIGSELRLSGQDAAKVQDDFANYIKNKLTEHL